MPTLKTPKVPSVASTKRFAKKFSKEDWKTCCESPTFIKQVDTDLAAAEITAVKILSEVWDWHDDSPYDF